MGATLSTWGKRVSLSTSPILGGESRVMLNPLGAAVPVPEVYDFLFEDSGAFLFEDGSQFEFEDAV